MSDTNEISENVDNSDVTSTKTEDQAVEEGISQDQGEQQDDVDVESLKKKLESLEKQAEDAQSYISQQQSKIAKQENLLKQFNPVSTEPPPMPVVEHYEDNESYQKAVKNWSKEIAKIEANKIAEEKQFEREKELKIQKFDSNALELEKEFPDYKQKVLSPAMNTLYENYPSLSAALLDSENGAEVAYHLSQNITNATRIANLPENILYKEVGKIEENLKTLKQNKVSKASNPISTVKGDNVPSTKKMMDMSDSEILAAVRKGAIKM